MILRNLLANRSAALGAGVLLGAVSVTLVAAATARPAARQGSGSTTTGDDGPIFRATSPSTATFPAFGTADSNNQMIAVTGVDVTGSSILYLVDTKNRQLAVYQANGGSSSTQGLRLVGARKIDLDLELQGYADKSEYSYRDLQKQFADLPKAGGPSK